jgi:hypothetical protein
MQSVVIRAQVNHLEERMNPEIIIRAVEQILRKVGWREGSS